MAPPGGLSEAGVCLAGAAVPPLETIKETGQCQRVLLLSCQEAPSSMAIAL